MPATKLKIKKIHHGAANQPVNHITDNAAVDTLKHQRHKRLVATQTPKTTINTAADR